MATITKILFAYSLLSLEEELCSVAKTFFLVLLGIVRIPYLASSCQPGRAQALVSQCVCQPTVDVWEILVSNVKTPVCKQLNSAADLR